MKIKFLQTCLFLTLVGLLILVLPFGRVSATTEWTLQVSNVQSTTTIYSYSQLLSMPQTTVNSGEYCYGYIVTTGDWVGVSLGYLLQQAGLDPTVASVDFVASDGYTVSLQIQEALKPDTIIAYELNGLPLSETLRLVLPEENGNMWIAMITSISMSASTTQPGIGGGPGIAPQQNLPSQTTILQNESVQTPTPAPKNETIAQPTATPTPTAQPAQQVSVQQPSKPQTLSFSVEIAFVVAIALAIVVAVTVIVRRSKNQITN